MWILFSNGRRAPFWTKDGYGHVHILCRDEFQYYILNPAWDRFEEIILPIESDSMYERTLLDKFTVVEFERRYNHHFRYSLTVMTCVEVAKYIIGIRSFFVKTPFQLYKYLIKHGGKKLEK